jgi:hypothetical protein
MPLTLKADEEQETDERGEDHDGGTTTASFAEKGASTGG